jgi:ABC-2 type transport system permease protein
MLLTAYGVCAVSSAYLIVPVPAPGDNPFKRVPGATFSIFLGFLGVWVLAALLAAPEIVLAVLVAVTGDALFGWLALIVGVVLGVVFFILGIQIGGRILDRTAPDLLLRVRAASGS